MSTEAELDRGEGYTSCQFGSESDVLQQPSDHESHNDSVYFNFLPGDDVGIAGAVVRVGMRPNEGYSEASIVMPRGDGTVLFHYARSPLSADEFAVGSRSWESGALRLDAVEPTRRWRLRYASAEGRIVTDPALFGDQPGKAWRASDTVECEFDLDWTADFPMHVLSPGGNLLPGDAGVSYGKSHSEQFGRMTGTLRIGGEEWRVDSVPSLRDHSWGPRIWESAPDQDFLGVYLDDGRRLVAVANRIDGREEAHGVIWRPGSQETPVQIDRYEIRSDYRGEATPGKTIGWTIAGGDELIELEAEVVAFMPLRVGKSGVRIAQMILRLSGDTPGRAKSDLTRPIFGE